MVVTGGEGYVGRQTALRIADRSEYRVVLADNFACRAGVTSIVPVSFGSAMRGRFGLARSYHLENAIVARTQVGPPEFG